MGHPIDNIKDIIKMILAKIKPQEKKIEEPQEKKIEEPQEKKIEEPQEKKIEEPQEKKIEEPQEKKIEEPQEKKIEEPQEKKIEEPQEKKIEEPQEKKIEEPQEKKIEPFIRDSINLFADAIKKNIDRGTESLIERMSATIEEDKEKLVNDIEEYKKLNDSLNEKFKRECNLRIIKNLLIFIDNMNRCIDIKSEDFELLKKILYQILDEENVIIIEPKIGDEYNVAYHEAFEKIDIEGHPDGAIMDVVEIGCKFKEGVIIKRAKVKVCKHEDKIQ